MGGEDVVGVSVETLCTAGDRAVHGAGDCGWERGENDLAAFAADLQDSVAVFLTEVGDVGSAGFEDPQPK